MPKTTIVVEFDLPAVLLVLRPWWKVHDFVADNFDVIGFWSDQVDEQASDDGRHA